MRVGVGRPAGGLATRVLHSSPCSSSAGLHSARPAGHPGRAPSPSDLLPTPKTARWSLTECLILILCDKAENGFFSRKTGSRGHKRRPKVVIGPALAVASASHANRNAMPTEAELALQRKYELLRKKKEVRIRAMTSNRTHCVVLECRAELMSWLGGQQRIHAASLAVGCSSSSKEEEPRQARRCPSLQVRLCRQLPRWLGCPSTPVVTAVLHLHSRSSPGQAGAVKRGGSSSPGRTASCSHAGWRRWRRLPGCSALAQCGQGGDRRQWSTEAEICNPQARWPT